MALNNIVVISWRSVLLVEEIGNHPDMMQVIDNIITFQVV